MIKLPTITFNWIFNTFYSSDKKHHFDNTYTQPNTRRNYHVIMFNGSWSVHGEGAKKIEAFPDKDSALTYAKEHAKAEKTEAVLHNENATVETVWTYGTDAYPQE